MVCVLTLAASAGGLAVLLIVRLWAVLRSHPVTPRQSLGLLIVAGSAHRVLPSPNSEKPGGSAVLALLRVHYLVLHMVFLPTGSPNKARLGAV
ncbi:rCG28866, isoform CRA_b [Rattus norvegicus]|uniref:RCG28866, isoform CRA_b n=2 Tax=Rattus norvegicus TaxID=10116 RepID=A6HVD7_RAT|nr:rCG28866, isoform CRA_b [Rattus norvegicus]